VEAACIPAGAPPSQRLAVLLGRRARNPLAGMARALRCTPDEVAEKLAERGDAELVELVH